MKKSVVFLTSLCLSVTLLAGCGSNQKTETDTSAKQTQTESVTENSTQAESPVFDGGSGSEIVQVVLLVETMVR